MTILGMHLYAAVLAGAAGWVVGVLWDRLLRRPPVSWQQQALRFALLCLVALVTGIVVGIITTGHGGIRPGVIIAAEAWVLAIIVRIIARILTGFPRNPLAPAEAGRWFVAMLESGAVAGALPLD